MVTWIGTGLLHVDHVVGRGAGGLFLKKLCFLAMNHHQVPTSHTYIHATDQSGGMADSSREVVTVEKEGCAEAWDEPLLMTCLLNLLWWLSHVSRGRVVQKVVAVDTIRAYHFGEEFLVEIDIVLPPTMSLGEAHDIGESLQVSWVWRRRGGRGDAWIVLTHSRSFIVWWVQHGRPTASARACRPDGPSPRRKTHSLDQHEVLQEGMGVMGNVLPAVWWSSSVWMRGYDMPSSGQDRGPGGGGAGLRPPRHRVPAPPGAQAILLDGHQAWLLDIRQEVRRYVLGLQNGRWAQAQIQQQQTGLGGGRNCFVYAERA